MSVPLNARDIVPDIIRETFILQQGK